MADENAIYVKVNPDYSSPYRHVVMYDSDAIHPDAPVLIHTNSKGVFHVSETQQVKRLINKGLLAKTSKPKDAPEPEKASATETEDEPEPEPQPEPEPEEDAPKPRRGRQRRS